MRIAALVPLVFAGCSWFSSPPVCPSTDDDLAAGEPPLTCAEAAVAVRYVDVLAGRPTPRSERALLLRDLAAVYATDPARVRTDLTAMEAGLRDLGERSGLDAAEARSERAWIDLTEEGPLTAYPQGSRVLESRVAVWASADDERLVLTEADIEGWISYASLCREVQSGGPLRLSVAQREGLYRSLRTRFREADRKAKLSMVAVGPFWSGLTERWKAASYEQQQGWAQNAELPPPMTSTSLVYAEAVLDLSPVRAATTLHEHLGPLRLDGL